MGEAATQTGVQLGTGVQGIGKDVLELSKEGQGVVWARMAEEAAEEEKERLQRQELWEEDPRRWIYGGLLPLPPGLEELEVKGAPGAVEEDKSEDDKTETTCSICQDVYTQGQELRTLPCLHVFHAACIEKCLCDSHECPRCGFCIAPATGDPSGIETNFRIKSTVTGSGNNVVEETMRSFLSPERNFGSK
jgi:hypothetical protein